MLSRRETLALIYRELWKDEELAKLLGNPTTAKGRSERIRMGITPLSYATAERVNFISLYYSSTIETENMYAARGLLNIDYYGRNYSDLLRMTEIVGRILEEHDIMCDTSHDVPSTTKGVFIYKQIFKSVVWAQ